jgi:hypothetical protein
VVEEVVVVVVVVAVVAVVVVVAVAVAAAVAVLPWCGLKTSLGGYMPCQRTRTVAACCN